MKRFISGIVMACSSWAAAAQGQVNVICSVQAEWCNMISTVYARTTGTKVNVSLKGSGDAFGKFDPEKVKAFMDEARRVRSPD